MRSEPHRWPAPHLPAKSPAIALKTESNAEHGPLPASDLSLNRLDVSAEEVARLFEPFVAPSANPDDPNWQTEFKRRKTKIRRRYLKRKLLGWLPALQRRETTVLEEYSRAWDQIDFDTYRVHGPLHRVSPWEWRGRKMLASDIGATRVRQLLLTRAVEKLAPASVLEVGCGNGINLLLLACAFPAVAFSGIELTAEGWSAATHFQQLATLPKYMRDFAPFPIRDPSAFHRIRFLQGNAAHLPFADGEFDLVFTALALEQMEQVRDKALQELSRVARRHVFMIEPFREVNDAGWARRNVLGLDYFRGRIADLGSYGLTPVLATDDFPQETFLKSCAVLAKKAEPQGDAPQ